MDAAAEKMQLERDRKSSSGLEISVAKGTRLVG